MGSTQLHSELVRTTILKDFVEYFGISKYGILRSLQRVI